MSLFMLLVLLMDGLLVLLLSSRSCGRIVRNKNIPYYRKIIGGLMQMLSAIFQIMVGMVRLFIGFVKLVVTVVLGSMVLDWFSSKRTRKNVN